MFIVKEVPTVRWPVVVRQAQDGGGHVDRRFTAQFLLERNLVIEEILREAASAGEIGDKALLRRVLVGWGEDVALEPAEGEKPVPIPFSDEARETLIDVAAIRRGLMDAFADAQVGGRRKN